MLNFLKSIFKIFIRFDSSELRKLTWIEYEADLSLNHEKAKEAFDRAWTTRNFEIDLYWKRATYFWAIIASTFVGYFALVTSESYVNPDGFNHVEVYLLICIGFIFSTAWFLINKGSKTWQKNWEVHIDLLEDNFTGPLYKTINATRTFSVSKINEIVSFGLILIWGLLGAKYLVQQNLLNFNPAGKINWFVLFASIGVILGLMSMLFGYGRGKSKNREFEMYRRKFTLEEKVNSAANQQS
jgi:hypothetical protein